MYNFNLQIMKPEYQHKSPEAAARERAHQFGQPNGNPIGDPHKAGSQRAFYAWCEKVATLEELEAYVRDARNPYARRKFVQALKKCDTVQDFFRTDSLKQCFLQERQRMLLLSGRRC